MWLAEERMFLEMAKRKRNLDYFERKQFSEIKVDCSDKISRNQVIVLVVHLEMKVTALAIW
jgi:hypothetical protein